MVEFLLGILSNLVSSLLGKLNIPRLFPTSQTRFWDPVLRGGLVIVTPAEEQEANIKSQVFDFQGLDELKSQVINKYYKGNYKQTTCDNISQEWLRRNLLLIAGPIPNTITRHILDQTNESIRYYFDDHNVVDKKNPERTIQADLGAQGYPPVDYGIITKLRNPFNREKWVVIASGMFGWGTYAALVALSRKSILDVMRQHSANQGFQIIVKTRVYNRIPEEPILNQESIHVIIET